MFAVEDIDDTLARLRSHGAELVGEVAQYEDTYRLCYVRGPEGILIGLAEQIGSQRVELSRRESPSGVNPELCPRESPELQESTPRRSGQRPLEHRAIRRLAEQHELDRQVEQRTGPSGGNGSSASRTSCDALVLA
jgi:hypothetical protein